VIRGRRRPGDPTKGALQDHDRALTNRDGAMMQCAATTAPDELLATLIAVLPDAASTGPARSSPGWHGRRAVPVPDQTAVCRAGRRSTAARVRVWTPLANVRTMNGQTPDNQQGVPASVFDSFMKAARQDTPAWMKGFLDNFYNFDRLRGTLVSDQAYQASWNLAASASAVAAVACIPTWGTDFRADLPRIDVPMLVIHGDDDQVLPYAKTAERLAGLITDVQTVVIGGGPHAIPWTHSDQVNSALLTFVAARSTAPSMA
jgi:pimeloyl-ACP methyl ester carboxylesterase